MTPDSQNQLRSVSKSCALVLFVFACLFGLVMAQPQPQPATAIIVGNPGINHGLAWDHVPGATGYNVKIAASRFSPVWTNYRTVGFTNHIRCTNSQPPVYFRVCAVDELGTEGDPAFIGLLGVDKILTVFSEVATNLNGAPWTYLAPVAARTNSFAAEEYFRLRINSTNRFRTD